MVLYEKFNWISVVTVMIIERSSDDGNRDSPAKQRRQVLTDFQTEILITEVERREPLWRFCTPQRSRI